MDNLTLDKWCSEHGLMDEKIDFITSFMTLLSTSKYGGYGLEFIIEKFNYKEDFSEYKIDTNKNYINFDNFNEFCKINIHNNFDAEEFLHRCYEGGICKPLAMEILQTK